MQDSPFAGVQTPFETIQAAMNSYRLAEGHPQVEPVPVSEVQSSSQAPAAPGPESPQESSGPCALLPGVTLTWSSKQSCSQVDGMKYSLFYLIPNSDPSQAELCVVVRPWTSHLVLLMYRSVTPKCMYLYCKRLLETAFELPKDASHSEGNDD